LQTDASAEARVGREAVRVEALVGALWQMHSEVACVRTEALALYTASEGLFTASQLREQAAAEARAQVLSQQEALSRYCTCVLLVPKYKALTQNEKEAAEARDGCCLLRRQLHAAQEQLDAERTESSLARAQAQEERQLQQLQHAAATEELEAARREHSQEQRTWRRETQEVLEAGQRAAREVLHAVQAQLAVAEGRVREEAHSARQARAEVRVQVIQVQEELEALQTLLAVAEGRVREEAERARQAWAEVRAEVACFLLLTFGLFCTTDCTGDTGAGGA
jgi:hypothetical protein